MWWKVKIEKKLRYIFEAMYLKCWKFREVRSEPKLDNRVNLKYALYFRHAALSIFILH